MALGQGLIPVITYQYHCDDCGSDEEQDHPIGKQPHAVECPCGHERYQVLSAASFKLKGRCWSHDGYGRTQRANR